MLGLHGFAGMPSATVMSAAGLPAMAQLWWQAVAAAVRAVALQPLAAQLCGGLLQKTLQKRLQSKAVSSDCTCSLGPSDACLAHQLDDKPWEKS